MAKTKKTSKKLSKNQLKKLKGGYLLCHKTTCSGDTCSLYTSEEHCTYSEFNSMGIATNPGKGGKKK